ncbi:MAG: LysM peptidoglycan-binding domain-containing protein, partial [Syntrophomonas sp.]|nr:LysM peptidoglycan-binding domain-containing protein [Syntrophomonas sp.]
MKYLDRRWIGSLAVCIFLLALGAHPSVARLSEGNFVPFSQAANNYVESQAHTYCIKKGDTLYKIAQMFSVNLNALMQKNGMDERTILEIGTVVKIPVVQRGVHVVMAGDTMYDVAK